MEKLEFQFMGFSIEKISIIYGTFLIIFGISISLLSNSDSFTSYIPTIFGIPIFILGYLSRSFPKKKMAFMHIIVLIGVIIFFGGMDFLRSYPNFFENFWADFSKLILLFSGLIFTVVNIKSFIFIRKNR